MSYPTSVTAPVQDGKAVLSIAQKQIMASAFKRFNGQDVRITISSPLKTRSKAQNAYMWGVVYTMIAAETGHSTEEIHEYMKDKYLPKVYVSIKGEERELTKSTTALDTMFFESYLEQVRAFAATELSMTIPLPHEVIS